MVRRKNIENEINGCLAALEQNGYAVKKAILFGSMAKGNPHEYSDIDLAVWCEQFTDNYFLNIEKTAFKNVSLKIWSCIHLH